MCNTRKTLRLIWAKGVNVWWGKPWEYWLAVAAAALYVSDRHREPPLRGRVLMVAGSSGLGVSLSADVAAWGGWPETVVAVLLIAVGYLVLDMGTAILQDRSLIRDILRRRFGK